MDECRLATSRMATARLFAALGVGTALGPVPTVGVAVRTLLTGRPDSKIHEAPQEKWTPGLRGLTGLG